MTAATARRFRLGIDIGGTFTDCVIVDRVSGAIRVTKVPTVPSDPSAGFLNALETALSCHDVAIGDLDFIAHGTTVATNTIIEGKGTTAGLITSEGFSDVLEIAYQTRTNLFDLFYQKPRPLVARRLTIGVPERTGPQGEILVPLDEAALRDSALHLRQGGASVIVVAFLHSYRFPAHEQRARAVIAEACPGLPVVLSSDICREPREYPRTSTAVVNAVLLPAVGEYVARLEEKLRQRGAGAGLHLMTSSGGIISSQIASQQPVHLLESGPAATVVGANFVAKMAGFRDIIVFDMGGTTAKAAPVTGGMPRVADQFEVGPMAVASDSARRGLGYPVRTPVVEMVEVSAGGGSVAWLDPGGALSVGPESMAADPGPACYGRGGDRPTITDANLLLGRLDPNYFLGGAARLEPDLAATAVERHIARPLGLGLDEAAEAVIEIAAAKMAAAMGLATIRRGIDPRGYALVACGGAGPLHAAAIVRQVGIGQVIIPPAPGLTSALGLLATDLRHDFTRQIMRPLRGLNPATVTTAIAEMREEAIVLLRQESVPEADMHFRPVVDLRYIGQSFNLGLSLLDGPVTAVALQEVAAQFHAAHKEAYGFASEGEPLMMVAIHLIATGAVARPAIAPAAPGGADAAEALKSRRKVHFREAGGRVDCAIYDRVRLRAGNIIAGPAIIEQMDTTTLVPPGAEIRSDASGVLIMTVG